VKETVTTAVQPKILPSTLGLIKRNSIYLTEEAFATLCKNLVRPHLEYVNMVWKQHRLCLIEDLEKVRMRATKLVLTVKHLTYKQRFLQLILPDTELETHKR